MIVNNGKTKLGRIYDLTLEITKYEKKNMSLFFKERLESNSDIQSLKILIEIMEILDSEKSRLKNLSNTSINKHIKIIDTMIRNYRRIRLEKPDVEWKNFTNSINSTSSTVLLRFEFIVDMINEQELVQIPDSNAVFEIIESIEKINKEIIQQDFPKELKDFALKQLGALRVALFKYIYYGSEEIDKEVDAVLGAVAKEIKNSKYDYETAKPLFDRVYSGWFKVYSLLCSINNTPVLIEGARDIFDKIV